jgi:hypothetical protein
VEYPAEVPISAELRDLLGAMFAKAPGERITLPCIMQVGGAARLPLRNCRDTCRAAAQPVRSRGTCCRPQEAMLLLNALATHKRCAATRPAISHTPEAAPPALSQRSTTG